MMNRNAVIIVVFVLVLAAIAGGAAWYLVTSHREAVGTTQGGTATTTGNLTGEAIYTNGPNGFVIIYPETAQVEDVFSSYYHLGTAWRANALPNATGTPVVAIVTYDTKSDHSYPRYYDTMVRIGVSSDKKEIAGCLTVTKDQGETTLPDATFGGATWKAFAFQNAGMMQYVKGVSYRTMHEGTCVVVEKIAVGSSYKEDAPSTDDIAEEVLVKQYEGLDKIVTSFTFVR